MKEYQERLYRDHSQVFAVDTVLHRCRTRYQDVLIFENQIFGRVLTLDGIVQLTELDNHIYHEMIAHVPLTAHWRAEDVLIIGGGDGGTLREVLKHPVRRVVVMEIDADVVELSKRFFPDVSGGAFDDPRTSLLVGDAADFVTQTREKFDVIIVDSTDPFGPGEALFSDSFYRCCRSLLRLGGLVSLQSGVPFFRPTELEGLRDRLSDCFGAARPYLAPVPTYACGALALFAAGSSGNAICPPIDILQERFLRIREQTRFYTPDVHGCAFAMAPSFSRQPSAAATVLLDS